MLAFKIYCAFMLTAGAVNLGAAVWSFAEDRVAIGVLSLCISLIGTPLAIAAGRAVIVPL